MSLQGGGVVYIDLAVVVDVADEDFFRVIVENYYGACSNLTGELAVGNGEGFAAYAVGIFAGFKVSRYVDIGLAVGYAYKSFEPFV